MEKTKPDLLAASGTRRPGGSKRILAQLEHGPRQPVHPARAAGWTIDGWTIGLFALLLLMCSVAWMMHDQTITPKTFRHDYGSGSSPSASRHIAERTPTQEQPATIVNEAAPRSGADDEAMAVAQADTGSAAAPAARSAHAATATPRPAAPTARTATPAATTTPAAVASSGDTDVTLLTALMAHASKPAAVTSERPRDVVERQDGDTTAQLLARCKQLGLIEGMLCRSRICSGRWEADAACRAPSH